MTTHLDDVHRALRAGGGVLRRRDHRELGGTVDRLVRNGRLVVVLPGVYAPAGRAGELDVQVRALMAWRPDAVITGAVAARLSFWPELEVTSVSAAGTGLRDDRPGYALQNRRIEPDHVVEYDGVRITVPALTALDLCPVVGGDAIDHVLRSRRATLAELHEVLADSGGRRSNRRRRALLLDSRDEPWSEAEREAHRLLRAEGITGWTANLPVLVHGSRYYLDLAFAAARLAIEIDGRCHDHSATFEKDRSRQNDLVLAGWRVLRFTWAMLTQQPAACVAAIRQALAESR